MFSFSHHSSTTGRPFRQGTAGNINRGEKVAMTQLHPVKDTKGAPGSEVEGIDDRLASFGLDATARRRLRRLRRVIHAVMGPSLARFYTVVRANPTMRSFFSDDRQMDSAKDRQITHWDHLAEAPFEAAYRKAVRKVGGIHARIGLEPRWYIGGYALILEGVTNRIVRRYSWSFCRFLPGGASSLPQILPRWSRQHFWTWICRSRSILKTSTANGNGWKPNSARRSRN